MESPNKRSSVKLDIRLTPEARDTLESLAKKDKTSSAEIVRKALKLYFAYHVAGDPVPVDVPPAHWPKRKTG